MPDIFRTVITKVAFLALQQHMHTGNIEAWASCQQKPEFVNDVPNFNRGTGSAIETIAFSKKHLKTTYMNENIKCIHVVLFFVVIPDKNLKCFRNPLCSKDKRPLMIAMAQANKMKHKSLRYWKRLMLVYCNLSVSANTRVIAKSIVKRLKL